MRRLLLPLCLTLAACGTRPAAPPGTAGGDVVLVADELVAALAILEQRAAGSVVPEALWDSLRASEGYRRLGERERTFKRPFADSAFRAFLESDTLLARLPDLRRAAGPWQRLDAEGPVRAAAAYLPAGTPIRARLYPLIKPVTNTFVFGGDSVMGIFFYLDPAITEPKLRNTLTHELHHIGYSAACPGAPDSTLPPATAALVRRLGGFSEGMAMLAAAGGPTAHPHATSDSAERARWDRDIAAIGSGFTQLEGFIADVREGRITSPDSVIRKAMEFYGIQGPWYTVGWVMASTVERTHGRDRLLQVICDPVALMRTYNEAAGAGLPKWSDATLAGLPFGGGR